MIKPKKQHKQEQRQDNNNTFNLEVIILYLHFARLFIHQNTAASQYQQTYYTVVYAYMTIVDVYQQPLGSHDSHNAIPTPKKQLEFKYS